MAFFQPPSQLFVPALTTIYNYSIRTNQRTVDLIYGARVPFAGQPLNSLTGKGNPQNETRYAVPFSPNTFALVPTAFQSPQNSRPNCQAMPAQFPSMTDFYNNYAYAVARYTKTTESSRQFAAVQGWRSNGTYIYNPATATRGVTVRLSNPPLMTLQQSNLRSYYNAQANPININYILPECDETRLMKDGIRIYRNFFDIDSYLARANMVTWVILIQNIDWKLQDASVPYYVSQQFRLPSNLPYGKHIAAYCPFIDQQYPNVTQQTDFIVPSQMVIYTDMLRYIRDRPQILFIQNNANRTMSFVPFNPRIFFTLTCTQTPDYIFLCFSNI